MRYNHHQNNIDHSHIVFIFLFKDYVQMEDKWCESDRSKMNIEFRTRQEAENACNKNKNCKAFYDAQSKNDTFIICAAPLTKPSKFEKSTLYMKCKKVKFLFHFNLKMTINRQFKSEKMYPVSWLQS